MRSHIINLSMFLGLPIFVGVFLINSELLSSHQNPQAQVPINTEITQSINTVKLQENTPYRHVPSVHGKIHGTIPAGFDVTVKDVRRKDYGLIEVEFSTLEGTKRVWIEVSTQ